MLVGADEAKMEKLREAMLGADARAGTSDHIAEIVRETLDDVDRADHLRRGARAVRRAPRRRAQDRDRLVVTVRGRRPARRVPRRRRGHRRPAPRSTTTATTRASSSSTRTASTRRTRSASSPSAEDIDLAASYAYSDSVTDLPMLEAVGHPVAVNPDKDLAREAKEREWEIRVFAAAGAPARPRARAPRRARRSRSGGMLAAAGAGAVVWWLLRRRPPPPTTAARLRQLVTR